MSWSFYDHFWSFYRQNSGYRISSYIFRLEIVANISEETIQGWKLYEEIRYTYDEALNVIKGVFMQPSES